MKLFFENGTINAEAETMQDAVVLFKLVNDNKVQQAPQQQELKPRKKAVLRKCHLCDKQYRHVNMHIRMAHMKKLG